MTRKQRPSDEDIRVRLAIIKRLVRGTADALPRAAAELRREATEAIDDLITDLTP